MSIVSSTNVLDVRNEFGAIGDGITDDSTSIDNAINTLGRDGVRTLYFPAGKYRISHNTAFPKTCSVVLDHGAMLYPDLNVTVEIKGYVDAGMVPVFCGRGTVIGPFANEFTLPQWWGANGYNIQAVGSITAGTNTLALTAAAEFIDGQDVAVMHAGPNIAMPAVSVPPVATVVGVPGSTLVRYKVAAFDDLGGVTVASAESNAVYLPNVLNSDNYVAISIAPPTASLPHIMGYAVYMDKNGDNNFVYIGSFLRETGVLSTAGLGSDIPTTYPTQFANGEAYVYSITASGYLFPPKVGSEQNTILTDRIGYESPVLHSRSATQNAVDGKLKQICLQWILPGGKTAVGATTPYAGAKFYNIYRNGFYLETVPALDVIYYDLGVKEVDTSRVPPTSFTYMHANSGIPQVVRPEIPKTAPTAKMNKWLLTKVLSGGGTATLTLADNATAAVADAIVLTDETRAFNDAARGFGIPFNSNGQSSGTSIDSATRTSGNVRVPGNGRKYMILGGIDIFSGMGLIGTEGGNGGADGHGWNGNASWGTGNKVPPSGLPAILAANVKYSAIQSEGSGARISNLLLLNPYQTTKEENYCDTKMYPPIIHHSNGSDFFFDNIVDLNSWIGILIDKGSGAHGRVENVITSARLYGIAMGGDEFIIDNIVSGVSNSYGGAPNPPRPDFSAAVRVICCGSPGIVSNLSIDGRAAFWWTCSDFGGVVQNIWGDDWPVNFVVDQPASPGLRGSNGASGTPSEFMVNNALFPPGSGTAYVSLPWSYLGNGSNLAMFLMTNSRSNVDITGRVNFHFSNCSVSSTLHGVSKVFPYVFPNPLPQDFHPLRLFFSNCTFYTPRFRALEGTTVVKISNCSMNANGYNQSDKISDGAYLYVIDHDKMRDTRFTVKAGTALTAGYNFVGSIVVPQHKVNSDSLPHQFNVIAAAGLGLTSSGKWALETTLDSTGTLPKVMTDVMTTNRAIGTYFMGVIGEGDEKFTGVLPYQAHIPFDYQKACLISVYYYSATAVASTQQDIYCDLTYCATPSKM